MADFYKFWRKSESTNRIRSRNATRATTDWWLASRCEASVSQWFAKRQCLLSQADGVAARHRPPRVVARLALRGEREPAVCQTPVPASQADGVAARHRPPPTGDSPRAARRARACGLPNARCLLAQADGVAARHRLPPTGGSPRAARRARACGSPNARCLLSQADGVAARHRPPPTGGSPRAARRARACGLPNAGACFAGRRSRSATPSTTLRPSAGGGCVCPGANHLPSIQCLS